MENIKRLDKPCEICYTVSMSKWDYIETVCKTSSKANRKQVLWRRYLRAEDQNFRAFLRCLRRGYGFQENGDIPAACEQFIKADNIRKRYIKEK